MIVPGLLALLPECRPRERLLSRGPSALSDAELLAILLGSGRPGQNVLQIAQDLLSRLGDLRGLGDAPEARLVNGETSSVDLAEEEPSLDASPDAGVQLQHLQTSRRCTTRLRG